MRTFNSTIKLFLSPTLIGFGNLSAQTQTINSKVIDLALGKTHTCVQSADTVSNFGNDFYGQTTVPSDL